MTLLKSTLLASAAGFAAVAGAQAADLPVKKAAPIEYVRICTAYGAGFFYIPGTDTCIRLSGRARFEGGYETTYSRQGNGANVNQGDTAGYSTRLRINVDARTQTSYGTLRAFLRLETGSRTGGSYGGGTSGTQQRIGNAFPALGQDQFGRAQQYVNTDKAFVQFAGFTAGRASSFFDFYAHDFEFAAATGGSDVSSTNLLAYTGTFGNGFSATISIEDPTFRRSNVFSPLSNGVTATNGSVQNFGVTSVPAPIFLRNAAGGLLASAAGFGSVDVIQRNEMPDFVGALRYDAAWGSAQISAASHQIDIGNINNTPPAGAVASSAPAHTNSPYGYAVQGGLKINAPFIAPGDTLYLQGAYANGAQMYTGYCAYTGCYAQTAGTLQGSKFQQYFNDATVNPVTGQLQLSDSFTVSGAYLHYWAPEWRSAFFGSYGEMSYAAGARAGQAAIFSALNPVGTQAFGTNAVGAAGSRFFNLSQALRDTYQFVAGASIIWSPVKDLDIGLEGFYTQIGVKNGRVIDLDKDPTAYTAARVAAINAGGFVRTTADQSVQQIRVRVQRDF